MILGSFTGAHVETALLLTCLRWDGAYLLRDRQRDELMPGREVAVDHATINRWGLKYRPQPEVAVHRRKRPVWLSCRMDEP